jgi:lysozyme
MKINTAGLDIIKYYEGWSSTVYKCPAGVGTIGYGSTWDMNGKRITMDHKKITKDYGEQLLLRELRHINYAMKKLIKAELTENMYSSLASLTYNIGSGNLQHSTLRMKLNKGLYEVAADEFLKWRKAGGKVLKGLVRRRAREQELFLTES